MFSNSYFILSSKFTDCLQAFQITLNTARSMKSMTEYCETKSNQSEKCLDENYRHLKKNLFSLFYKTF